MKKKKKKKKKQPAHTAKLIVVDGRHTKKKNCICMMNEKDIDATRTTNIWSLSLSLFHT